jgi:hypothetical protein
MVDADKCRRCSKIAESWYGRPFADVLKRFREKPAFQTEIDDCSRRLAKLEEGTEIEWPLEQGFFMQQFTGARTEFIVWFLAIFEFNKMFGVPPAALGGTVYPWFDEYGATIRGVFLKPSGDKPEVCRRVIFFYEKSWRKEDTVVHPEKRLREQQASEAFDSQTQLELKKRPAESLAVVVCYCRAPP